MSSDLGRRQASWAARLAHHRERAAGIRELLVEGVLNRMVGMTLEAVGCEAAVGGRCMIQTQGGREVEAEVVGFSGEKLYLMPTGEIRGLMPGARVVRVLHRGALATVRQVRERLREAGLAERVAG